MSSGDYLRYLRARKGGPDLITVNAATGVPSLTLRELEQRYRIVGDDESLAKLAEYYGIPTEELLWRQRWSRKALSAALVAAQRQDIAIEVNLRSGQTFRGKVDWWDLGAAL